MKPVTFYPARLNPTTGKYSLFTNECDTAHEAKQETQKLIDSNSFGTSAHVVAGYAYFNSANEIIYVFPKEEDILKSLDAVRKSISGGATRKYAKLEDLKKAASFGLLFLGKKGTAEKVGVTKTFKELALLLNF